MCHYARAYDKSILNNQELAQADQNIREWAAIGYTPMIITTAGVGAAEVVNLVVVSSLSVSTVELACADGDCSNEVRTGSHTVYQGFDSVGNRYIGMTNNFFRRAGEQLRNGINIEPIQGLEKLSKFEARALEQVLIEWHGLNNLLNKINSISTRNPIYTDAMRVGESILNLLNLLGDT